jgi:hypothetical protein
MAAYDEKAAPVVEDNSSSGVADASKGNAFHEETAHEAAERGHYATDQ